MFVYSVTAQCLWSDAGKLLTRKGFSGFGEAVNNPYLDDMDIGSIPLGMWQMLGAYNSRALGTTVIPLLPLNHKAKYRIGFNIYGNAHRVAAPNGVELPIAVRRKLSKSNDKILLVIE